MLNQRAKSSSRKPPKSLVTTTRLILHKELWSQGNYSQRVMSPKARAVAAGWVKFPCYDQEPGLLPDPQVMVRGSWCLCVGATRGHSLGELGFHTNSATGPLLGCSVSPFPGKADLLQTLLRFTPEKFCRSTSGCNEPIILIYPHEIGKYLSPCGNFHNAHCDLTVA